MEERTEFFFICVADNDEPDDGSKQPGKMGNREKEREKWRERGYDVDDDLHIEPNRTFPQLCCHQVNGDCVP